LEWQERHIKIISKVSISLDKKNNPTVDFGNNIYNSQYLSVKNSHRWNSKEKNREIGGRES